MAVSDLSRVSVTLVAFALRVTLASATSHAQPAHQTCSEDHYGTTTSSRPAPVVLDMFDGELTVCGSDDWYALDLPALVELSWIIELNHGDGDLDIELLSLERTVLATSDSATNQEHIQFISQEDQPVLLHVYGFAGATGHYSMSLSGLDFSPLCEAPTDGLESGQSTSSRVCRERANRHPLRLTPGEPVSVLLLGSEAAGDLDLVILDEEGRTISRSDGPGHRERVEFTPRVATLVAEVRGHEGAIGEYELSLASSADAAVSRLTTRGVVAVELPYPALDSGSTPSAPFSRPIEGATVELIDSELGTPLASTLSASDGSFELSARVLPENARLRVTSYAENDSYRVTVSANGKALAPYEVISNPLSTYPDPDNVSLSLASDSAMGGALNILHVVGQTLRSVLGPQTRRFEAQVLWSPGGWWFCGSCYSNDRLLISGSEEDPDQFDDTIIAHELSHMIVHRLSLDDSPGGSHDGSPTNPRRA
ncbi:MAG: carboxypeptidase regulatory-like domain-containing protein, partial [Myxococcales bacterium]|nr:carboxypeptidase regulatory-like domain-containing protein [Myxococcales bacterium]